MHAHFTERLQEPNETKWAKAIRSLHKPEYGRWEKQKEEMTPRQKNTGKFWLSTGP